MRRAILGLALLLGAASVSAQWDSGAYQYTGGGGAPICALAPSSIAFGSQTTSTTSGPQYATLSNTGTANCLITGYGLTTGTQFAIGSNTCSSTYGNSLPAGQTCLIGLTFTPLTTGAKTDTLSVVDSTGTQTSSLSGTGVSGSTWTFDENVHNFTCTWSSAGTTQSCAATVTLASGESLEAGVAAWNLNASATWHGISGDVALVHPLGCSASGTASGGKQFYSDLFYVASDAGATSTITVTLNTTSSSGNMDVELVPVTLSSGTPAFGGCGSVGYAASAPGCVSSPCVSPALSLSSPSNAVFQGVALGYGPPATIPGVYTYDPDVTNVYAAFAWAPNLSSVTQITWDSTNAANYPAASVMALKPYSAPVGAPVGLTVIVTE